MGSLPNRKDRYLKDGPHSTQDSSGKAIFDETTYKFVASEQTKRQIIACSYQFAFLNSEHQEKRTVIFMIVMIGDFHLFLILNCEHSNYLRSNICKQI